jgi:hypothetical protein
MEAFIFAVVLMGSIFVVLWFLLSKKGQRAVLKTDIKREMRRGMREEELIDGLHEQAAREIIEEERRKKGRA